MVFFFMRKTAYEMRIRDWSSDVCSSDLAQLIAANGLTGGVVYTGQRLSLLPSGESAVPGAGPTSYTVRSGDTLSSIAQRHGTTVRAIADANDIADPTSVVIGSRMSIPGSGGGSSALRCPVQGRVTFLNDWAFPRSGRRFHDGNTLFPPRGPPSLARLPAPTVRAIADANDIDDPTSVVIGARLSIPGSGGGSSALRCPVQGRVTFMNDWGFPRSGGRFHEGNDLFAPRGTPFVAVVSGTVVQTTGRIGGRQVKLAGDDGVSYYGTHLDGFGASGRVNAGDVIGYVGTTGNAAGGTPHVHFEVHPGGGAAVNPYPRIRAVC